MQDPISRSAGVERETHNGGLVPSQCNAATRPDVFPSREPRLPHVSSGQRSRACPIRRYGAGIRGRLIP